MALTGLAVALIPLYLVGAAIYVYFGATQEQNQRAQLQNLAVNRANAVQLFLAERIAMLEALVHTTTLEMMTRPGELEKVLGILNRRQHSFVDLGIIDGNGDHLSYEGPYRLEDHNYGGEPWFEETMVRGVHVSDVFLGFRRVPHFVIAIRRDVRPQSWILRATIDSEVFTHLVRSGQVGLTGDAYIVNRDGHYQTPPRFGGEILGQIPFSTTIAPPGINVMSREAEDGRRVLTAFAWMPSKDWLLVIDRDPRESMGPLRQALKVELIALLAASLLVGGAVVFHTRQLVGRLAAEDRNRVAGKDADMAISVLLVDDEETFVQTLAKRLTLRRFNVYTATGAERLFESLAENLIDVVLLDVKMPDLDGIEATRSIKTTTPRRGHPAYRSRQHRGLDRRHASGSLRLPAEAGQHRRAGLQDRGRAPQEGAPGGEDPPPRGSNRRGRRRRVNGP